MGLLVLGHPLSWAEAKKHADYVRHHGILQYLHIHKELKTRSKDCLKWGDEVEYFLVRFDDETKTCTLSLRAKEFLDELTKEEKENPETASSLWRPEYSEFVVEGTPGRPYGNRVQDFADVQANMRRRRLQVQALCQPGEHILTLTNFPMLGVGEYSTPSFPVKGPIANSAFISDQSINGHPRFGTLTKNIRERRGSNVAINLPLFQDINTIPLRKQPWPDAKDNHVYMDAMCFGMGCCCLQCTFQACNINEARTLYDQLAVMSPIMLALTAATPFARGYLVDTDVRWHTVSASVDDRTEEERGLKPLKENKRVLSKSRYESISTYISLDPSNKPEYSDLDLPVDEATYKQLKAVGTDELMARHLAHLWTRDPLVIYKERLELDDSKNSDHFENLQSTNWQTVRFKPPPPGSDIGWRVEFRPMEVNLTDFENASFVIFIVLLSRTILSFDLNLYAPISKVDENMERAHRRGAVTGEKFFFRKNIASTSEDHGSQDPDYAMLTIAQIMLGTSDGEFPGLINLIHEYLDNLNIDLESRMSINRHLDLVGQRAAGALMTTAEWARSFIMHHPKYKHNSVITPEINYDLCRAMHDIMDEKVIPKELLGDLVKPAASSSSS